jgi:hypothetical protein
MIFENFKHFKIEFTLFIHTNICINVSIHFEFKKGFFVLV